MRANFNRKGGVRRRSLISDQIRLEPLEIRELLTGGPTVVSVLPLDQSANQWIGSSVSAKFDLPLNPSTVNSSNVTLVDENGNAIPSAVSYSPATGTLQLIPTVALAETSQFTATLKGGPSGLSGTDGSPLSSDQTWSFTTGTFVNPVRTLIHTVKFDKTNGLRTNAAGGEAVLSAVLTAAPTSDVTVPLSSSNPDAATVSTSALVFTPDNWNMPQAFEVMGTVSSSAPASVWYTVDSAPAQSDDPAYDGVGATSISMVNLAVDTPDKLNSVIADEADRFAYVASYGVAQPMPMMDADMTAAMMAQQEQALALVPISSVTNMVVRSGDWSDPNTWSNGQLPQDGANVWVLPNRTLTIDGAVAPDIKTIRVSGTLAFSNTQDTSLNVDTIEVDPLGSLVMGTEDDPIPAGISASITFTDDGPVDRTWDPYWYSRGIVSQGSASIVGAAKTGSGRLAAIPDVGASSLFLAQAPTGWQVGDLLLLPATSGGIDEQFHIASISGDGRTIGLDSPVTLARQASRPGESLVVSNLTRNINIGSQTTDDPSRRGHVMFMHNNDVDVRYASFNGLGRTDFSKPINNAVVDKNGNLVPGTGTNPRGRYAFHIHMAGTDMPMDPVMVVGVVVNDSDSWGFDNHSSNVDFEDDIAFNTKEAGFATESGDEIGTFNNNVAVQGGHVGYWLNGPNVTFTNNVAAGFNALYGQGVEVWAYSNLDGTGTPIYLDASKITAQGALPPVDSLAPDGEVRVEALPFHLENTQVYDSWGGIEIRAHIDELGSAYRSTVDGGAIWGVHRGLTFNYSTAITVNSLSIYGDGQWDSSGVFGDLGPQDLVFKNLTDVDWGTGITFPGAASFVVQGGLFNNTVDFRIYAFDPGTNAGLKSRSIVISGVIFGNSLMASLLNDSPNDTPYTIYLDNSNPDPARPFARFLGDRILYNGRRVYFDDQGANIVVTGTGNANYDNHTNLQLWKTFGVTTRGTISPTSSMTNPNIFGGTIDR